MIQCSSHFDFVVMGQKKNENEKNSLDDYSCNFYYLSLLVNGNDLLFHKKVFHIGQSIPREETLTVFIF
jgi:hypothetical protein